MVQLIYIYDSIMYTLEETLTKPSAIVNDL